MKNKTTFLLTISIAIFLWDCSKPSSNKRGPRMTTLKVVEYGTGVPIPGATFHYYNCIRSADFGCATFERGDVISDRDGLMTIQVGWISSGLSFDGYWFNKEGYWNHVKGEMLPVGADYPPIEFSPNGNLGDSLVVKLFPMVKVRIHLKKTTGSSMDTIIVENYAICCPDIPQRRGDSSITVIGTQIDTVVYYPVFGNTMNQIYALKGFTYSDTIYNNALLVNKGHNTQIEINW